MLADPFRNPAGGTRLYRNGRVHTPADPHATALLVEDGRIAWVGGEPAADALADGLPADAVVDTAGLWIAPGFVDAHVHATATGLALTGLDLSGATSLGAALDLLRAHAVARPHDAVLLGTGWDETSWPEGRAPTIAEVDRATDGRAAYLTRVDLHAAVATGSLLQGLSDAAGVLRLDEHHTVRARALASVSSGQARDAQRAARSAAAAQGIVSMHEMAGPEVSSAADLAGLLALASDEPGPDVVGCWADLGDVETSLELGLRTAGGDLFCDGTFGSRTAALTEPYADRPDQAGVLLLEVDELAAHIRACEQAGLQPGFHVIGDRAFGTVLTALEQVGTDVVRPLRARIEHAELPGPEDIRRAAALGVVASVQPVFDRRWAAGMYVERLGAGRAARTNPLASYAAAGVGLAFGSDSPVTPADPWAALRSAVAPTHAVHALSPRAAFAAHTRGGWRAARLDADGAGTLVPGAPATFVGWDVVTDLVVRVPDHRVSAWSTDPRARVAGIPDLSGPAPQCRWLVVRGHEIAIPAA